MLTIAELRSKAKSRLPRMIFDHIDGGAGPERAVERNMAAFDDIRLVPRILNLAQKVDPTTELLGMRYSAPFGVSPMGLVDMAWPGTELALARTSGKAGLPYCLSTAASTSVEQMAAATPHHLWFQIYLGSRPDISEDLLKRAEAAGVETLVFTVDANSRGRRLRDLRNHMELPLRPRPDLLAQFALHPRWSLAMARAGGPTFGNMGPYASNGGISSLAAMIASLAGSAISWRDLENLRARWRGKLLVKGVLHPQDATRIQAIGADGIVVSNHGGRQLSGAISTIEALPPIRAAVGPTYPVVMDSGVRSGEDVVKALACGADFVLLGRPFLYAAAALGPERGATTAISILRAEFETTMAQIGCATIPELRADHVWEVSESAPPRRSRKATCETVRRLTLAEMRPEAG